MNLDSVNTPADLVQQNNEIDQPSAADLIMDMVLAQGVTVGHELTCRLLVAAISLHQDRISEMLESDEPVDPKDVMVWTADLQRLITARQLVGDVDL